MRTLPSELIRCELSSNCTRAIETKSAKSKERLSSRELRELMGVNRDTYKRVGGAIRKR